MLTADLVQVSVRGGCVHPRYIDTSHEESLALADALIRIFAGHVGEPRYRLDSQLREFLGSGTAFLLHRGLAKLLLDRCEFATSAAQDPAVVRQTAFRAAAGKHRERSMGSFDREAILKPVRESLGLEPEECERNLYADLKEEEILEKFKKCSAQWLLERYNVSLAQAVLLRATELEIQVPPQKPTRYRQLFRQIKFCQLLYQVEGTASSGYRLRLDGPLSLFKSSQRYGVQMANFLPALLHCQDWSLEAAVLWGKQRQRRTFRLTPQAGLRPPTRSTGQWQPEEMRWLGEQFPKLQSEWEISSEADLVDLGGRGVLVPDYVFRHGPTGRQVFLEVFGFWRRGAVESRLKLLREHGPSNLILGLARELGVGEEELQGLPSEVYVFRSHPIAREVLALLETSIGKS